MGLCVLAGVIVSACKEGGGGAALEGCGSDVDCKGERVCEEGMCVDPADSAGDGDGDGASGDGDGDGASAGDGDGDGDAAGDGDGDSGRVNPIDDPALEAACMAHCQARWDADCLMGLPSLDQCNGQCLIIDETNGGYCNTEQRAQYNCLASGGYACVNDYAQPNSTCALENQALQECYQQVPCWMLCDQGELGCTADRASCLQKCDDDYAQFDNLSCAHYYNQLQTCWGQQDTLDCQGGEPSLAGCGPQAAEIGDCLGRYAEPCAGFCWVADKLGCGTGCDASCVLKVEDDSCGYYYERVLDCAVGNRELYMRCDGDTPVTTGECASDVADYTNCMMNP